MIKILAGEFELIHTYGSVIFVEKASADFEFKLDNGPRQAARQNLICNFAPEIFQTLRLFNLSATEVLWVVIWTGVAGVTFNEFVLPPTAMVGQDVNLAAAATQDFPGINSTGQRRKQFTMTLKPALVGNVSIADKDTGKLLAIVAASSSGGGFALETDANLRITNNTAALISSTVAPFDIAVAETFYK
jgi:hypothetical protein